MLERKPKAEFLVLGGIMCLCLCALLWGLNGDSPICSEHDEFCFAPQGLSIAITHDLNPHWFVNPASTLVYPLAAYYSILELATGTKYIDHETPTWKLCFQHMDVLIKWPRLVNVLLLVASLPLLYLAGRVWVGQTASLLGVFFYAFSPLVVYYAQILRPDSIASFFLCLGILLLSWAAAAPTNQRLAVALGICAGLATSTRYFCVALIPPILTLYGVHLLQPSKGTQRKAVLLCLLLAIALWLLTFFCTSPYVFLDFKQVVQDLGFETQSVFSGVAGLGPWGNLQYYINEAFPESLGTILMIASGIGLVLLFRHPNKLTIVYTVLLLVLLVGTCLNPRHWNRWTIPMLPIMCLLAAFAITTANGTITQLLNRVMPANFSRWLSLGLCTAFTAFAYFFPFRHMLCLLVEKSELTGRAKAFLYIRDHIPKHSKIACDMSWDWPDRDDYVVLENIWRPDFVPPRPHKYYVPQDLANEGYQYMIVQRWNREDYARTEPDQYPREAKFFIELEKRAPLLYDSYHPRPIILGESVPDTHSPIEVYDLRPLAKSK